MWEKVKLGEICKIRTGKLDVNAENPTGLYPFFTCSKNHTYIDDYAFNEEAIIVAGNGDLNVKYYKGKFNAYQRTYVINPFNNINGKFLFYFLDQYVSVLRNESIGGVIKYIKLGNLTEALIPLPPLHIQEKIAEILDKADELRRKDQELQNKYDQLAQAIFIDMFGDPVKNEKGWEVKKLEEFIDSIVDVGSNGANDWVSKNIQMKDEEDYAIMIRTTNFANNDFVNNLKYVSKETYELFKKTKVFGGEIIMNKIGSAGDFWSMPFLNKPVSLGLNQLMIRISSINQVFLLNQMSIKSYKKFIKSKTQGAITKSITKGAVKNLDIIFPPIHLQEEFAKKIEIIHQLKAQTNAEKSEELFQSLLQKAFKGELVS